ncbi:MAG: type II toxin-antitoxin system VapC family toxin [Acidobacteria bacterium]|nr:type II toxin-antitoxin system VapC family toxin [Acidobacteriota bacterium]
MRAVDTNVLVRLLVVDDPSQAQAAADFIARGAGVPLLALAEATWVLESVYERTPRQIADAVAMLLDHKQLIVQDADVAAAALALFSARPALGFSDCLILESARKAGHLPLGTFDKSLARSSGAQKL